MTLLISNCHHSRILIDSQRARALARAFTMHMQIIAVGVTNRRDQQKARFVAFVVLLDSFDARTRVFFRFLTL